MAHYGSHYSSRHRRRHHRRHKYHDEEDDQHESDVNDEQDEKTQEEAVHTDVANEDSMPADSAWSTPYLDPESGSFTYQGRKTVDGQWEYMIAGSRSGIYHQDPIPVAQEYAAMSTAIVATPYVTGNLVLGSYAQYPQLNPYQLAPQIEVQEYSNVSSGDAVAPEVVGANTGEEEEVRATESKEPASDRSVAGKGGASSHRRHEKRRDDDSSHHRRKNRHNDGHGHMKKTTGRRYKDVDGREKVSQWLDRSFDDESIW
ncbi:hypothetical protein F5X99DRAFT_367209 [Biscogniauxia marginata]|nr:hypothetical protein F5X99DRAFT_367209 [Biscogniauxia marginata]